MSIQHVLINGWMLIETAFLHGLFAALAMYGLHTDQDVWLAIGIVLQGICS